MSELALPVLALSQAIEEEQSSTWVNMKLSKPAKVLSKGKRYTPYRMVSTGTIPLIAPI